MKCVNIVYITDDNYVDITLMSIYSLFKNKKNSTMYKVYILCDFLNDKSKDKFNNICNIYDIILLDSSNYVSKYKNTIQQHRHVSTSALLKFFLPDIFNNEDILLYLDSDTIIQSDLSEFYNTDISNYYAAVVKDTIFFVNKSYMEHSGVPHEFYFNSGVMLLNLNKMREENISKKLIDFKMSHDTGFMDQDALNAVLGSNVIFVSWKYNFLPFYTERLNSCSLSYVYDYDFRKMTIENIISKAIILHLGGPDKPWKYNKGTLSSLCFSYMNDAGISTPLVKDLPFYEKKCPHSPAVSVLMPSLNSSKYIRECLNSVLNQRMKDIEIICIDAGSTDGTLDILNEYKSKDYRINIINSSIKSYGYQLNLGLSAAKGEYISIVETDDYIDQRMYEEQCNVARKNNIDVLKANYKIFYGLPEERKFTYINVDSKNKYYNKVLNARKNIDVFNTTLVIWTGIYKKSFLDKNNIRFNETPGASYQDNGFYFQTYALADRIWIMSKDYYRLRRDNPNSSVKNKGKVYAMCDEYAFIEKFVKERFPDNKNIYGMYLKKKKQNYLWNLTRISEEYKKEFLARFGADFKEDLQKGNIRAPFFGNQEIQTVTKIVNDSNAYYEEYTEVRLNNLKKRLSSWYLNKTGKNINLECPNTYNEKMQWIKLYDSTKLKTNLSDPYEVRNYVKNTIGEDYLIPLINIYNDVESIDFNNIENGSVISCSHIPDVYYLFDKNNIDIEKMKLKLSSLMSEDYSENNGFELYYKNIKPRIIITHSIDNNDHTLDYKLWSFNGKIKYIQVSKENEMKTAFYDTKWNRLPFIYAPYKPLSDIPKPKNIDKILELGNKLSKNFSHVIVDFCCYSDGKLFFKKMIFSLCSGVVLWSDSSIDKAFGDLIILPKKAYNIYTDKFYNINIGNNISGENLNIVKNSDLKVYDDVKIMIFGKILYNRYISNEIKKWSIFGIDIIKKEIIDNKEYIYFINIPIFYMKKTVNSITKRILFFKIIKSN